MSFGSMLLLALGVSADAFAVALGQGLQLRRRVVGGALILGAAFGIAQAAMPLIGWALGSAFADLIAPWDHWIAFILLAGVGAKMLWEAFHDDDDDSDNDGSLSLRTVLVLAVATSIDALAIGVTLSFLDVSIWWAVALIGITTFVLSVLATLIGHRVGTRFRKPAETIGALVLIGIGTQILIEHLIAG